MLFVGVALLVALHGVISIEIFPAYQKIFVEENADSVVLPCKYRKAPLTPSSITWTSRGKPVITVDQFRNAAPGDGFVGRVRLGEGASLILTTPTVDDSATYTCTITMPSGANPTATGEVVLEVTDCVRPDITAAAVCLSLDVAVLISLVAWFILKGRPGVIQVTLVRRILICVAVGSLIACIVSGAVLIVYVSTDCVQGLRRLKVAGILFCVLALITAILVWLLSSRKHKRQPESVSAMYEDDSETYKAMLDGGDGVHRTSNGGGVTDRESPHIPDDMVKIIGNSDSAPGQRLRRFEELRTREHVDMTPDRFPPESPGLSDVFFDDDVPGFARPATYRSPGSVSSSASSSQAPRPVPRSTGIPPRNVPETVPERVSPRPSPDPASTQPRPRPRPQANRAPALLQLAVPDPAERVPLRNKSSMRKARSEEVLKRGASLVTIPPERRSLPLSVEEKLDQDIFLEACRRTVDYFVETSAYKHLEERLFHEDTRGITITGAPGDGKTATAMYAAWKLHSTAGFLPLKVRTVSEIERIYIEGLKLVFVVDDPFGKLCRSSELQDYWMSWSKRLQACLETTNVKIIATVRSDIWDSCRYSVMRFWPFSSDLSISTRLSLEEKHTILTKHLSLGGVDTNDTKWRETVQTISHRGSNAGYPQYCQLVRTSDYFKHNASTLFQNPTGLMRKDMSSLRKNDPCSFTILALMVIHGGKLSRALFSRPLTELPSSEREKIESIWKACSKKVAPPPKADEFVQKVDMLCKTYIVKAETSVEFSLTSLAEMTLLEIAAIDLGLIFKWCHADVIIGKLVPDSSRLAKPLLSQLNIVVPRSYYPQLATSLTEQLLTGNIRYGLENPGWMSEEFVTCWQEEVLTSSLISRIRGVHGVCCQGEVLHRAAAKGLLSILRALLGQRKEGTKLRNEYGQTLLHTAATGGHESIVRFLLEIGCPVDAVNDVGESSLYLAALQGHQRIVEILLEHKANPDLKTKHGLGALHAAVFGERTEIVSLLLPRVSLETLGGASRSRVGVTSFRDRFLSSIKHSGLHEAARTNDLVRIHHFLDNGFEKNDQNKYGWTPLYISVLLGHVEAAALFLTRGSDPNILSSRGSSPLDEACCAFNDPLISVLMSYSPKRSSCL